MISFAVFIGAVKITNDEISSLVNKILRVMAVEEDMLQGFNIAVTQGTSWAIKVYFHFVSHVPARRYSMPELVMKLNEFKMIGQCKEKI